MSHGCIEHCWIVPPTLNGNASLGQHSMGLHMEVQHVRVCGHSSHVYVCVCVCAHVVLGRRVASVASSCVLCVQLLVTSPNRTGSHALLIQSPPSSRAIEPISQDTAPCRALAHPLSWILCRFRNSGMFWHEKAHVKTEWFHNGSFQTKYMTSVFLHHVVAGLQLLTWATSELTLSSLIFNRVN